MVSGTAVLITDSGVGEVFDGAPVAAVVGSLAVVALAAGCLVLVALSSWRRTAERPGTRPFVNFMNAKAASPTINRTLTNARMAVLLLVLRRLTNAPVGLKSGGVS